MYDAEVASRTSTKGTIGELAVIADLLKQGFEVFKEVTASSVIDLIAYKDGQYKRIQVKTTESRNDTVIFPARKGQANHATYRGDEFDLMALYVVDKHVVLYLPIQDLIANLSGVSVRFSEAKNGAKKNVRRSCDFMRA